jgi:ribosomal-protein-serine acetyltransferase
MKLLLREIRHGVGTNSKLVLPGSLRLWRGDMIGGWEYSKATNEGYRVAMIMKNLPILIRPYSVDDAEQIFNAVRESLPDLIPWMPWCHSRYSLNESRSWLEIQVPSFQERTNFEFAIVAGDGSYLGGCGLNQIDRLNLRANLGYWVRSGATRHGVATAAVQLLRNWGFQNTDLIRFEIVIAAENGASRRVAEKAGATREGVARDRLLLHGAAHDATIFSFIRKEYGINKS